MNEIDAASFKRFAAITCLTYWACVGGLLLAYTGEFSVEFYFGMSVASGLEKMTIAVFWNFCPLVLYGGLSLLARRRPIVSQLLRQISTVVVITVLAFVFAKTAQLLAEHVYLGESLREAASFVGDSLFLLYILLVVPLYWLSLIAMTVTTIFASINARSVARAEAYWQQASHAQTPAANAVALGRREQTSDDRAEHQ